MLCVAVIGTNDQILKKTLMSFSVEIQRFSWVIDSMYKADSRYELDVKFQWYFQVKNSI